MQFTRRASVICGRKARRSTKNPCLRSSSWMSCARTDSSGESAIPAHMVSLKRPEALNLRGKLPGCKLTAVRRASLASVMRVVSPIKANVTCKFSGHVKLPCLLFEQINCQHQRLADFVGKKNGSKQTHKPTSSIYHISSIADTFCYFQHKTIFAVVILAGVRRRSVFL